MQGLPNLHGTSILLSMASFFKGFNHWSKDIIFLFSDHSVVGTQAFLQAYHGEKPGILKYEMLNHHGGEIREALTLDMPGNGDYAHLGMYAQGLNGQQANGDIVTVVTRLCQWIGAGFALQVFNTKYFDERKMSQALSMLINYGCIIRKLRQA
jgi:glycosylphosphatidylinositol transamidase